MEVIVVGVDRSASAKAALRFALEEARLRQARVRVVHAWQLRPPYGRSVAVDGVPLVLGANLDGYSRAAAADLDAIVAEAAPRAERFGIEKRVEQGDPATVLIDQSRDADLLVVGSRGHGGFASLLLGSPLDVAGMEFRLRCNSFTARNSRAHNVRRGRKAHLFRAHYMARWISSDADLLTVCRYVAWNPVVAGLARDPFEWPWSSAAASAGLHEPAIPLDSTPLRAAFADSPEWHRRYRSLLLEGEGGSGPPPPPRAPISERRRRS